MNLEQLLNKNLVAHFAEIKTWKVTKVYGKQAVAIELNDYKSYVAVKNRINELKDAMSRFGHKPIFTDTYQMSNDRYFALFSKVTTQQNLEEIV